ncbi:MAG: hypothetical protein ABI927_00415, partial [Gaiellaceae bacterium]
ERRAARLRRRVRERRSRCIVGKTTRSFPSPLRLPGSLAWSPDGKTLLLSPSATEAGPTELYSIGTDGRHFARFTSRMGATHGVTWR